MNSPPLTLHLVSDERLGNVTLSLCRLDLIAGPVGGNKCFKLLPNLQQARALGYRKVASFGGAWSNHLDALARGGAALGLGTLGFVRGDDGQALTPMLRDAKECGMELVFLSRADYRLRGDGQFLKFLAEQYPDAYWIPEGGSNATGVSGCIELGRELAELAAEHAFYCVALPCGTGGTLAGVARGLEAAGSAAQAVGYSVLKPGDFLHEAVGEFQAACGASDNWSVVTPHHGGGYARCPQALADFIEDFYRRHGIALDPVYSGKLMWGLFRDIEAGAYSGKSVLALHTGGLQGLRGYPALLANLAEMGFQGLQ